MYSNWTFLSFVLSSVLVHIGLASNSPHGKLCFIQLSCKPSSARRSTARAGLLILPNPDHALSQLQKQQDQFSKSGCF